MAVAYHLTVPIPTAIKSLIVGIGSEQKTWEKSPVGAGGIGIAVTVVAEEVPVQPLVVTATE